MQEWWGSFSVYTCKSQALTGQWPPPRWAFRTVLSRLFHLLIISGLVHLRNLLVPLAEGLMRLALHTELDINPFINTSTLKSTI